MNLSRQFYRITAKLVVFSLLLCLFGQKRVLSNSDSPQTSEIARIYEEWLEQAKIYLISDAWQLKVDAIERYECRKNHLEARRMLCQSDGDPYFYKIDLFLEQLPQEKDALRFWEDYNQQFYNRYGIELDDKLLIEASHLLSIPGYKVDIEIHTECSSRIIRMNSEYRINSVVGTQCHHREAQVSIPLGSLQSNLTTKVNSTRIQANLNNIQQKIIDFFENRYNVRSNSRNWQWINNDKNYISFSIRGLQNEGFRRDHKWQQFRITILLHEIDRELELTLFISGYTAPGAGDRPPSDSNAYSSMEPRYSGELQSYTDDLSIRLQQSLTDQ